jgi:hypothetical protein
MFVLRSVIGRSTKYRAVRGAHAQGLKGEGRKIFALIFLPLEAVMNLARERYHLGMATRKPYPSDVSDEEWTFVAPYLALLREDAPQRNHDLREVFNGLRWVVRTGSPWRP